MDTGRRLGADPRRTGGGAPSQVPREEGGRHPGISCRPEQTLTPRTLRASAGRDEDSGQHVLGEASERCQGHTGPAGRARARGRGASPQGPGGGVGHPQPGFRKKCFCAAQGGVCRGRASGRKTGWEGYRCVRNGALHPRSFGRPSQLPWLGFGPFPEVAKDPSLLLPHQAPGPPRQCR